MMCYQDKTFCDYYKECSKGEKCDRALTPQVQQDAEEWLEDPPISVFIEKPDCFNKKQVIPPKHTD